MTATAYHDYVSNKVDVAIKECNKAHEPVNLQPIIINKRSPDEETIYTILRKSCTENNLNDKGKNEALLFILEQYYNK